ncbi:protein translocase subunit yidC [Caminicella sporogenes DSM 14501]|uniref:Protein translocase subunit yidC n=1 Tax=Caminicella sporogenes DSM 14501 TaxID=1121266 RepID=A0A1M6NCN6_9FIRM|nr:YidC/Oxa1 family membrane protein insertase [Caminicella sporogenes]WIF95875.1 YidC/Oxa1 family membrane protein insertase [Caminicella sporogenes]SHJ93393.1 protein translocase subunit yidC [Caminicella sporogenes DSM 14501]
MIARTLGTLLNLIYNLVNNYGIAIILFTVIVKLILLPLTLNQTKQTKKMQKIQPKVKELQEKYKNDKEKLNIKIMELYKEHKINPLSGCLPMLIQIPIIYGLFGALRKPEVFVFPNNPELLSKAINAPFLWLPNLVNPDVFLLGNLKLPGVLPILAAITTYLSMNQMNTGEQAQQMKVMNTVLPLMILWWGISLPAGLTLYWAVSNIFQMAQQYFLTKGVKLKEESN